MRLQEKNKHTKKETRDNQRRRVTRKHWLLFIFQIPKQTTPSSKLFTQRNKYYADILSGEKRFHISVPAPVPRSVRHHRALRARDLNQSKTLTWGVQHSAEAFVRGSRWGGAHIPSPPVRPSALLLPLGGVSDPVFAVETVAWVSTGFACATRYTRKCFFLVVVKSGVFVCLVRPEPMSIVIASRRIYSSTCVPFYSTVAAMRCY